MKCMLCGDENTVFKFTIERFNPKFDIYECGNCGFQRKAAARDEGAKLYDEGYYSGENEYSYIDERKNEEACRIVWKARMKKLFRWDRSYSYNYFLDVGCSFGGFMQSALEFGYEPYGVEISKYSAEFAKNRFGKNRVYAGNIEELRLPKNKFSIVTMIEVIEHLYDPRKALENIYRAMKPGAVLLIQTADMSGRQAVLEGAKYHYYLPGHLSYFNRGNLIAMLKDIGFTKTRFIGGVEFGLIPKLRKSRLSFKKWTDYFSWLRITNYHIKSKITIGNLHLTSSMVTVGWK